MTARGGGPLLFLLALCAAWIAAWLVANRSLAGAGQWVVFGYWTAMKLALWIGAPALWPEAARPFAASRFGLEDVSAAGLARAGALGLATFLLLALLLAGASALGLERPPFDGSAPALLTIILIAPTLEEALFRGYFWGRLRRAGLGLCATLAAASAGFTLLHLIGWGFIGVAPEAMLRQSAVVFGLGLLFGLARWRLGLIAGAIPAHMANNLWASGLLASALSP